MRRASKASLSALLLLLALQTVAEAREVRVFTMQPKLHLSWLETRETYRDKLFALMDARERRPGAPAIQAGADDAASHLLGSGRDLVLWPESIGLFAALTGERGRTARTSGSLEGAIASLVATYAPQELYYASRFPELAGRVVQTRLLATSLTDTFGRTVIEPFAEMADRYDVYLHAGVDMVGEWRIVCVEKDGFRPPPGASGCDVEDPQRVAQLGETGRDYAYEAVRPDPAVMALVFNPDGRLVSKQVKTYLTPTELGPTEGATGLDLVPGAVSDGLDAVATPVGTLGFVTSKDAWMPDVVQKLDQRHVDLLVQPEFFVGNYVRRSGMWSPDTLLASGYNDVLRHPSFEALALPELTGGVFDFYADHQSHIAVKPRIGREEAGWLVGQPPAPGMIGVTPWVVPDPLTADEPFPERRRRLGEAGERLQPGSGARCEAPPPGPCEDGHVEAVLFRDVEVAREPARRPFRGRRARTRFSSSRAVSPSSHAQRNIAVARRGRAILLAFEERRGGRDQVFLVRSRDAGRTWSRRVRPTGRPRGATDEWWPAVALGRGRATVAWVDRSSGRERVYVARSEDGGRSFGPPAPLDAAPAPGVAQWRPTLAQGAGDVVHAAWIDERASRPEGGPQAGLFYARISGGQPEAGRRLDGGTPAPLAAKLDNAWAPSVAARDERVLVTWIDFTHYDWDVFARESDDAGERFGPERELNDTPDADEALNDSPQALLTPSGSFVAWTDWRKRDSSATAPHAMYDTYLTGPGGANVQVDPYGGRQASTFSPAACVGGADVLVAFQDASRGQNDIRIVRVADGERRGRAHRVDDAGRRGGNAWRPRLACSGGAVLAAWEDERDGPSQVYAAAARPARIP